MIAAYGLTGAVAVVSAGAFVTLAPRLSDGFAFLGHRPLLQVGLVVAVVLWNVFALQDAVLMSARWSAAIPVENGLFGVLKIVLMVVLARSAAGHGIFLAWLLAMAVLLVPVSGLVFGRVLRSSKGAASGPSAALPLSDRRRVGRYLAVDYLAGLMSQGYTALLPLLVIGTLGTTCASGTGRARSRPTRSLPRSPSPRRRRDRGWAAAASR